MGEASVALARHYAEATGLLLARTGLSPADVAALGVHGQTIRHRPQKGFTLQLNHPALVAELTGIDVVADLRSRDVAAGGEGAPLVPAFHAECFTGDVPRVVLNIGGIANCQLADADRSKMMAFDTGPGNVMIDHAMSRLEGKSYDADGALARTGTVIEPLLEELKNHPYFARPVPRSAWRLDFGSKYADAKIDEYSEHSSADLVATFTEFSAIAISRSIQDHVPNLDQMQAVRVKADLDRHLGLIGIEVLILNLTFGVSVHGVGKIRIKFFDIKMIRSSANFLIRSKSDRNLTMWDIFSQNPFCHGHDLCNSGLVVCTEDGISVAGDQSTTFEIL